MHRPTPRRNSFSSRMLLTVPAGFTSASGCLLLVLLLLPDALLLPCPLQLVGCKALQQDDRQGGRWKVGHRAPGKP